MMNKNDLLSVMIDDGRKFAIAKPGYKEEEVLSLDERVELAGHLLGEDIDRVPLTDFINTIPSSIQALLMNRIAVYCAENSLYNATPLLDLIQDIVRRHYEDNGQLQQSLTDHRMKLWVQNMQSQEKIRQQDREDAQREGACA